MKKNKNYQNSAAGDTSQKQERQRAESGYIYLVKNPASNEISVCAFEEPLKRGSHVIAPTRYGLDYGYVIGSAMAMSGYEPGSIECQGACLHGDSLEASQDNLKAFAEVEEEKKEIKENTPCELCHGTKLDHEFDVPVKISGEVDWIERKATAEDYARFQKLASMEDEALQLCREKVLLHNLDMKLVSAHYLFGESKIIFFFTAANRVDFRELVKDLVTIFKIRIELRQIGVRDESRVLGGLAVCGRDFCCHIITDKLNPVSIKMAKEQSLSLNSTKISGPCGRLLCCLSYEYDFYVEEKKKLPAEGSRLKVQNELMKITEVNILSQKISLVGSEGRYLSIPFSAVFHNEQTSRWEIDIKYVDEFLS